MRRPLPNAGGNLSEAPVDGPAEDCPGGVGARGAGGAGGVAAGGAGGGGETATRGAGGRRSNRSGELAACDVGRQDIGLACNLGGRRDVGGRGKGSAASSRLAPARGRLRRNGFAGGGRRRSRVGRTGRGADTRFAVPRVCFLGPKFSRMRAIWSVPSTIATPVIAPISARILPRRIASLPTNDVTLRVPRRRPWREPRDRRPARRDAPRQ